MITVCDTPAVSAAVMLGAGFAAVSADLVADAALAAVLVAAGFAGAAALASLAGAAVA
jgi:hypothetical protein